MINDTLTDCAAVLCSLPCKDIVFTRGNHEDENWTEFAKQWRSTKRALITLNGEVYKFGPLVIVGFPCLLGHETHFLEGREPLPYEADEWLMPLLRMHGAPARSLWLVHEPPKGTPLSAAGSVVASNGMSVQKVAKFSPTSK